MILENKFERYLGNERADKRIEEVLEAQQKALEAGENRKMRRKYWFCRNLSRVRKGSQKPISHL